MFDIKFETIINKKVKFDSKSYKFLSMIFSSHFTALIYFSSNEAKGVQETTSFLFDELNYFSVIDLTINDITLYFDDTVQYNSSSGLYKYLLEHYLKMNLIQNDGEDFCFYVSYGKPISNNSMNCEIDKIRLTVMKNNDEIYIGKEFYLKEGNLYTYNVKGNVSSFFVERIIATENNKTIVYTSNDYYKLNFFLKDYIDEKHYNSNEFVCDIIRDKELKNKRICSCELPDIIRNDNLYELFSVVKEGKYVTRILL